jgi:hypothetical protein
MLQPIHIKLSPSKLLLGLISGVSIACCWVLIILPIVLYLKLAIIALIAASSIFFILRDVLLRLPNSWQVLEVNQKGELKMINKSGQQFQLIPAPNSFIHAACSLLNFERKGFKLLPPVILLQNAAHADELRRLRVWLHWFKHQEDLAADLAA